MARAYYVVKDELHTETAGPVVLRKGEEGRLLFASDLEPGGRVSIFARGADVKCPVFGELTTDRPFAGKVLDAALAKSLAAWHRADGYRGGEGCRVLHAAVSLGRLFLLGTLGIALAVGLSFYALLESSRASILARSDTLRERAAQQIDQQISQELGVAATTLDQIERAMRLGALDAASPEAIEAHLFTEILDHPTLSDVTVTRASFTDYDAKGEAMFAPGDRWQISVFRATAEAGSPVFTRRVAMQDGVWATQVRRRPPGGALLSGSFQGEPLASDPTLHDTFTTAASRKYYGKAIWSDLAWSELDGALPEAQRRVVVSLQKAVDDKPGHFAGVVRVGLLTSAIDELPRLQSQDSERVLLCDLRGRLVARLAPEDRIESQEGELRVVPAHEPPEVAAALGHPRVSGGMVVDGVRYLVTFQSLVNSQEWLTAILVPEDFYTRDLRALRDRLLGGLLLVTAAVLVGGGLLMRTVRRSLAEVVEGTRRMRSVRFRAPARALESPRDRGRARWRRAREDVDARARQVRADRSRATALREQPRAAARRRARRHLADVHRHRGLHEPLRAPRSGRARPRAGALPRGDDARGPLDGRDGRQVHRRRRDGVLERAHAASTTIRASLPCRARVHARRRAASTPRRRGRACRRSSRASALHTARVMVGHFGVARAPELHGAGRRREPRRAPRGALQAVRGRGPRERGHRHRGRAAKRFVVPADRPRRGEGQERSRSACTSCWARPARPTRRSPLRARTRRRFDAYLARDFDGAMAMLSAIEGDPPSRLLRERCRMMKDSPPPEDWNGVYVATSK